jgi:hypothetical protein
MGLLRPLPALKADRHRPVRNLLGPHASSDRLRKNLVCERCGHRGALLFHPSWVDMNVGWQPFPTDP